MEQGESPQALSVRIGHTLQSRRRALGWDVQDVAQDLRIRRCFLEAIELGDFSHLPSGWPRNGFVCSYADYLGFDADDVARYLPREDPFASRRFEVEDRPLDQGPRPSAGLATLALLIAVLVYGIWQATLPTERHIAAAVAPVPDHLLRLVPSLPPSMDTLSRSTAPQGVAPRKVAEIAPAPAVAVIVGAAEPPAAPEPAVPTPAGGGEVAAVADVAPDPDEDDDVNIAGSLNEIAVVTAAAVPPALPAGERAPSHGDAQAAEPLDPFAGSDADGRVFGADGPSRVVMRAKAETWIQVRDVATRRVILSRLLRPGDVYRVPDRPGMKMITGNAGGLEILVDGRKAPALGASGAVRHGIALEADALLSPG